MVNLKPPGENPFPYTLPDKTVVIDEKCRCGKPRSKHTSTIAWGHGVCVESGCAAFTWAAFVFKK